MPDISMCHGGECPHKDKCYRHTAKPDEFWQTYMSPPYDVVIKECDYFWDNGPYTA